MSFVSVVAPDYVRSHLDDRGYTVNGVGVGVGVESSVRR
jgi:hypothetical protein